MTVSPKSVRAESPGRTNRGVSKARRSFPQPPIERTNVPRVDVGSRTEIDSFADVDESVPRLVILRGNSGSGKTTLAHELQLALGGSTANIGQDHFRRVVLREHDVPDGDNIELIASTARYCLGIGYHVILEGILVSDHYGAMLRRLVGNHPGLSHVFYLDVPLEETLRRHEGRQLRATVAPDKLRDWYVPSDVLGISGEVVIDGSADVEETLRIMCARIGVVPLRGEQDGLCRCVENKTAHDFSSGHLPRSARAELKTLSVGRFQG